MWVVVLEESFFSGQLAWGPFSDEDEAQSIAAAAASEIGPATVAPLTPVPDAVMTLCAAHMENPGGRPPGFRSGSSSSAGSSPDSAASVPGCSSPDGAQRRTAGT